MEARITELEAEVTYQEHVIQELNDVVTGQQKQIDILQADVRRILVHLKEISPSQIARPEEEVPPPHY